MASFYRFLLLSALFLPSSLAVSPTVNLGYSTYKGSDLGNGVSEWLGLRFAAPPVEALRFEPPQDPIRTRAIQDATKRKSVCIGTASNVSLIGNGQSEDCLFVNVWAPTKASSKDKLPVFIYIQGGGFNVNSNPNANGTKLVIAGDRDMIVVAINYRVGLYGFLNDGNYVKPNIGLLDQRKALQWVQKHIAKFGGDPGHVVIGGESAGAASVSLHLSAFGGKDEGLFVGAAAESISFATLLTVNESHYQYKNLAIQLGCLGKDEQVLRCIRSKSPQEIKKVDKNIPSLGTSTPPLYMWTPVIDNDLIPDVTYRLFEQGKFIKVPLIAGDDTNGGTVFTPSDTSTLVQSDVFLNAQFPFLSLEQLDTINHLYPNQNKTCPNTGCYWRQAADAYGDMRYKCPGLYISNALTKRGVPKSWNYLYNVEDPAQVASGLGVPHTVEIQAILGPEPGSAPASYLPGEKNAPVVPVIQGYWASFIRTLDPNKYRHSSAVKWEPWTEKGKKRVVFETGGKTKMESPSAIEQKRCNYFASIGPGVRQ
ncbi:cholinesterase precursor [Fusarium heterosporum]|uniref:Carboxylic ester hydrolase n=1 Tax=Fusarium heterosporum TaxID=42747 RepID=A0A8H5SXQ5_FUSHE|nr:cholinesterase precursor [Fusarium heterosporum]